MENIKKIVTQFVLIVFSVVLGIYLSERIEERKTKKDSEDLLTTIKAEVKDNFILLEDWVPYHREMKQRLDSLSEDPVFVQEFINDKYSLYERLLTRGSFMKRGPTKDAWDIAKSHPLIVHFDYDKWIALSRIYNQQETTFEPVMKVFELLNSKDINAAKDVKANLELMSNQMHELVAREIQLLDYYRQGVVILGLQKEQQ
jgi:hypothetical protein